MTGIGGRTNAGLAGGTAGGTVGRGTAATNAGLAITAELTAERTATLTVDLAVQQGAFRLEAAFRAGAGRTLAVVGPNGAGKTTLLRAIAGLVRLERGRVELGGRTLEDTGAALVVPPERRPIGVVFQDLLLFPHLSALGNVAYGLRYRGGLGRAEARRQAASWLERLDVAGVANRRPAQLSGGEAQRVALARALAPDPDLLLLDEPLSALDATARPAALALLVHHLAGYAGASLVVTHDASEALALADRLLVLESGRVVQEGDAGELRSRPATPYVATLLAG